MPFKIAQNYTIALIKNDNSYKFELLFDGTLIPVIGTPANNVKFSDSSLTFEVNINYPNMVLDTGSYKIELKKENKKTNYYEIIICKDEIVLFKNDINSSFEDNRIKASFSVGNIDNYTIH